MSKVALTAEQKARVKDYLEKFRERLEHELSEEGWEKERRDRMRLYKELLSEENVGKLSESDFERILKSLWSTDFWRNKDYLVRKVLQANGIERIRKSIGDLLYGKRAVSERFDLFMERIKGLGPSSVTEILVFVFPDELCLWNDKPKNVLPMLGLDSLLPERVFKYPITGEDYERCNEVLAGVRDEMRRFGFQKANFLDVDILMWLLFTEARRGKKGVTRKEKGEKQRVSVDASKIDHWDAIGLLLKLGNLLGYDTYTPDGRKKSNLLGTNLGKVAVLKAIPAFTYEKHLQTVKNVDVIWFKDEFPAYCFEVEHTTGVTQGLLRMYQIRSFTTAKFFVIAPAEILPRFKQETTKDPFYQIKNRYQFKSYADLVRFFDEAERYHTAEDEFLGEHQVSSTAR